jgi:hypothetical protein
MYFIEQAYRGLFSQTAIQRSHHGADAPAIMPSPGFVQTRKAGTSKRRALQKSVSLIILLKQSWTKNIFKVEKPLSIGQPGEPSGFET